jgi:diguanylate cyclase (GGDEF)-like protein
MLGVKRKIASVPAHMAAAVVQPEERRLAGVIAGALYGLGGLSAAALAILPGVTHAHTLVLACLAVAGAAWGCCSSVVIDWERTAPWAVLPSTLAGLVLVGVELSASGGADSPAWIFLFPVLAFVAYFFLRGAAYTFIVGCIATYGSVLLYDHRATGSRFLVQFALAAVAYLLLGSAIVAGKRRMWALRKRAETLAAEQGALRRVATAVVSGEPAEKIYERVAFEVAALLDAGAAGILKLESSDCAIVTGSWSDHPGGRYEAGTTVQIVPGSDVDVGLRSSRPVRIDEHGDDSPVVTRLGSRSSIVAPINLAKGPWGVLAVSAAEPGWFTAEDEQHLMEFGDLLATAIGSIEDRAKLAAQASTDTLTGLANHGALQKRVAVEIARAMRHGTPLSLAVIDIDHFKEINDTAGHETGDEMLVRVAECLSRLARVEDTLGRLGGDEFAWVLPETSREQALVAVERARRMIAATMRRPYKITVSAGICDTSVAQDASQLISLADGALYWSKAHGRNQCWIYDPTVINELSAAERAERLERSQALLGLRALARAIDAKDPATSRHSERVSDLVYKLAIAVDWEPERARMLSEAALVHDVGKVGVPDTLLLKPGPLNDAERAQIREHAELAARIVEDVLAPEQVEWIRTHHERPDGGGYPRGLRGDEIPEGAALLAAADSWDVMTISRPYSLPKSADEALTECIGLVGRQFTRTAIEALVELHTEGELGVAAMARNARHN